MAAHCLHQENELSLCLAAHYQMFVLLFVEGLAILKFSGLFPLHSFMDLLKSEINVELPIDIH